MAAARLLTTAFVGFVILGMPKAAFGVAWPSIADDLGRDISELGAILAVYIVGYFVSSVGSGEAANRWGLGPSLAASGALGTVALAGYAVAESWVFLLGAALVLGLSGGLIDAGVNAYVALKHTTRVMGFLHASFGVGATLGPLLMTVLVGTSTSWRWGYAALTVAQLGLTLAFWVTRRAWGVADRSLAAAPRVSARLRPGMMAGLLAFVLYSGVEVSAGQWAFSLLTEARQYADAPAGLIVTGYWAALTVGRIALGVAGDRWSHGSVLAWAMAVIVGGLVAFWWDPVPGSAGAGLIAAGFGMAPVFPLLMQGTPARLGADYATHAVGYQLAAATIGAALIPGGIGLVVAWIGLDVIPPVLVASAVGLTAVAWVGRFLHPRPRFAVSG